MLSIFLILCEVILYINIAITYIFSLSKVEDNINTVVCTKHKYYVIQKINNQCSLSICSYLFINNNY